jgi:hypothetical protein
MDGRRLAGLLVLAGLSGSCDEDEPRECETAGTPTCASSLVVILPDPRPVFSMRIRDDVDFDASFNCPGTDSDNILDEEPDYQFFCGAGRVTLQTNLSFERHFFVQLESGVEQEFREPPTQFGADFCGNTCTTITATLN